VIGYNNTLLSFRDSLNMCCFAGPALPDFSGAEPGFSVFKRDNGESFGPITMLEASSKHQLLMIFCVFSNDLLNEKIQPTATLPLNDVPSPMQPGVFSIICATHFKSASHILKNLYRSICPL
jgi:hypothetical protein